MAGDCDVRLLNPEVKDKLFGDRELPDDVIKNILAGIQEIKDAYDAGHLDTPNFNRQMNDYITKRRTTAEVQAMIELQDAKKIKKMRAFIRQEGWKGNVVEAFHSILTKSVRLANESALSVSAKERGFLGKYMDHLRDSLVASNTMKIALSGEMDVDIAKALDALMQGTQMPSVAKEAIDIAKAYFEVQNLAFMDVRDAGLPTKYLKRRVALQTHDSTQIKAAGFDKWFSDVMSLKPDMSLFGTKALTPEGTRRAMKAIYDDIIAGRYGMMDSVMDGQTVTAIVPGRISEQAAAARQLQFSAENQVAYMKKYGSNQTLMQAIFADASRKAKQTAMFERLGDKPRANFEVMLDKEIRRLQKKGDPQAEKLKAQRNRLMNEFDQVAGSLSAPGSESIAKFTQFIGALETGSKLGNLGIRAISNLAGAFADIKTSTGKSYGGEIVAMVSETVQSIPQSSQKVWLKRFADITDVMNGQIRDRMYGRDLGGRAIGSVAKAADMLLKVNGHHIMNDAFKTAITMVNQMSWADEVGKNFDQIPPQMQAAMLQMGVTKEMWPLMKHAVRDAAGRTMVVPEAFGRDANFPPGVVEEAMKAAGFDGSQGQFLRMIENNMRAFLIQRADVATTTAGAREASRLNFGTQNGTIEGAFMRIFTRFKSFTAQSIGMMRTFSNSKPNADLLAKGVLASEKDLRTTGALFAQYIILGSGIAYLGDTLIKVANGKEPNDPSDPRTWFDAMAKSGAGGLQVDFFAGNWQKYSFLEAAVGPTFSQLNPLAKAVNQAASGNPMEGLETGGKILRNYIPFQNMVGSKLLIDYAQREYLNEMLDPGSADRARLRELRQQRKAE